ncbi:MAG: hypothetical protein Q9220_000776 [cf. Caloplaca sp. 1 TL-2023]
MEQDTGIERTYPKRKRARVSYYISDSEGSENEGLNPKTGNEITTTVSFPLPLGFLVRHFDDQLTRETQLGTPAIVEEPLPEKRIFPFMSLPAELKNEIYHHALSSEYEIMLVSKIRQYRRVVALGETDSFQSFRRRRNRWGELAFRLSVPTKISRPSLVPNLLVTNREIYAETQPILYGANVFALEDTITLLNFAAGIGRKNCETLRELSLKHYGDTATRKAMNHPAFSMLVNAVNLTRLNLDCAIGWPVFGRSRLGESIATQFYRDAHHWLEAVGYAKGRRDAAVDIIFLGDESVRTIHPADLTPGEDKQETLKTVLTMFREHLRELLKRPRD